VALGALIVLLLVGLLSLMVRFRRALGVEVVAAQMAGLRGQPSHSSDLSCSPVLVVDGILPRLLVWAAPVAIGVAVSMAERAAEVGGTLQAGPTPTGGRVQARLPLEPT
jgi:hypothetical protein